MKKIEIEKLNNNIEGYILNNLTREEVIKYNLLKSKFLIYPHIYIINYRTGGHSICHSNTSFSTATTERQKEINAELSKRYVVKYEYFKRLYA